MRNILSYKLFEGILKETINNKEKIKDIPTYKEAVKLVSFIDSPFYEVKLEIEGYNISIFNYRLANWSDFNIHGSKEMRGLTFVFNKDGSLFNRFVLLEKFFNLNQVPDTLYSVVKNYKIKYINNKEDGSIASFIKLPNGKVLGKSKMGFDNDQANGINRVYKTNPDVKSLVDWALDNDIVAIFEYVAPQNRIVLRYSQEELILLRLRDNKTGKHIDIKDHLDKLGSVRIAPFEDDYKDLDHLIEVIAKEVDKEGVIVQTEDEMGNDFFFKLKTPWYTALHGLLTNDIYREHIIINHILDDNIDDILGQIPEEQPEAHQRINKIISIVIRSLSKKASEIDKDWEVFLKMGGDRKEYALKFNRTPNFSYIMKKANSGMDSYELAKDWLRGKTKRLLITRDWLKKEDPSLFFIDPIEDDNNN